MPAGSTEKAARRSWAWTPSIPASNRSRAASLNEDTVPVAARLERYRDIAPLSGARKSRQDYRPAARELGRANGRIDYPTRITDSRPVCLTPNSGNSDSDRGNVAFGTSRAAGRARAFAGRQARTHWQYGGPHVRLAIRTARTGVAVMLVGVVCAGAAETRTLPADGHFLSEWIAPAPKHAPHRRPNRHPNLPRPTRPRHPPLP